MRRPFLLFAFAAFVTVLYHYDTLGVVAQLNGLRQPLVFLGALVYVHDMANSDRWASFSKWFTVFSWATGLSKFPFPFGSISNMARATPSVGPTD